jgi:hypothetical protein
MDPPLPFVAAPVPTETLPLLPTLVVPELKLNRPDTPLVPADTEQIVNDPLDVADPIPLAIDMAPPDVERPMPALSSMLPPLPLLAPLPYPPAISTLPPLVMSAAVVLSPATILTLPPAAVVPAPTVMVMDPALPLVDAPVPMDRLPLLPSLVVPELKLKRPDTPLFPALTEWIVNDPLDVDDP